MLSIAGSSVLCVSGPSRLKPFQAQCLCVAVLTWNGSEHEFIECVEDPAMLSVPSPTH